MQSTYPKRRALISGLLIAVAVVVMAMLAGCGGSDGESDTGSDTASAETGEKVTITMWHGQEASAGTDELMALVDEFNQMETGVEVDASPGVAGGESILDKTTAALAAGDPPNIAFSFGSNIAQVARSPEVLDLTESVEDPAWDWEGVFPSYRDGVTIDGKVLAVPGPGDSLAIIYNKTLFKEAGVPEPKDGWTWDDYRTIAKELTDPGKGVYGAAFQSGGSLDSSWPFWPQVWQRGGEILAPDNEEEVGWDNDSALGGLEVLRGLNEDQSVYADTSPGYPKMVKLFNNGNVGMFEGDPWMLPGVKEAGIDYGIAPMPAADGNNTTIASPEAWFIFDKGSEQNEATEEFMQWFTAAAQESRWNAASGNLPARQQGAEEPAWQAYEKETPGIEVFTDALGAAKVVPRITAYEAMSEAIGHAIQTAILEDGDLEEALASAAEEANSALQTGP